MAEEDTAIPPSGDDKQLTNGLENGISNGNIDSVKEEVSSPKEHKTHDKNKENDGHRSKEHRDKDSSHKDRHKSSHRDKDRHSSSHKSSHSHKDRDRDKDKDKERSSDKDKLSNDTESSDKDKSRSDKDKSSRSDKDKDRSRSDKDKSRSDKDRDKSRSDRDKDKSRSDRDKDKDKDKSRSDKDKSRSEGDKSRSDRDKHRDKEHRDKDKDKHRDKDKEKHRDKDKERSEKDKERHKDKDKERSDRDKHRDKDKPKDDKGKEIDKHREDKDRKSSSGDKKDRDKDKHRSSSSHKSSHKDRHHDKDKDKHRSKHRESKSDGKGDINTEGGTAEIKMEDNLISPKKEFIDNDNFLTNASMNTTDTSMNTTMEQSMNIKEESTAESEEEDKLVISEPVVIKEEIEFNEENIAVKYKDEDDDDVPLNARKPKRPKTEAEDEEDDDVPLISRKKLKKEAKPKKRKKNHDDGDDEEDDYKEDDFKPIKKKIKKEKKKDKKRGGTKIIEHFADPKKSPSKKKKEKEEEENVWKWWEETKKEDGTKWKTLEHKGPVFPDAYVPLPSSVKFTYDGKEMSLTSDTEEVAGFYARMLEHDYTTKEVFNRNFFKDWRKVMSDKERHKIIDLKKCDFKKYFTHFQWTNEQRKNRTKDEKKALKAKNEADVKEYGWCNIDGHTQRIGNFKIEPPGLFRGRGEHPKQGMLKKRLQPEQVIINCGKDSNIPKAPEGHKWKEVRHDIQVTWLACWVENVQAQTKYVMLNAASKLKGEKDWQKYETARRLHKIVDRIRDKYRLDWKSKEMRIRQRAVALYFIDKLALRAGNEKDEDQADTVGCCSLRVEHLCLHESKGNKEYVVEFDFLGKDSIRYYNEMEVDKRVYKNLKLFMDNKQGGDDIFDRLNTAILNKHLNELMEGLTAKVFRTYNASRTLQEQLERMTKDDDPMQLKVLSYNRANREVAILCNHQRAVPKTHDKSMQNLQTKIDDKKNLIEEYEKELKRLKREAKSGGTVAEKVNYEKKKKTVERMKEQLDKLEINATDKEENKQIALGTSKLNYLDPRISVAWCKRFDVPLEKVYNKTQRQKFQWAIDMATADYNFTDLKMNENSRCSNNDGGDDDDEEEEEEE